MSKSEALSKLRYAIDTIETAAWMEEQLSWGERAAWIDDHRRYEVLRDLKSVYHSLGGPRL